MKKILKFLVLLLLLFPVLVKAETCSKTERNRISSLIKNIDIRYKYINDNNYQISIYNIPKELYVETPSSRIYHNNSTDFSKEIGYSSGKSYTFEIYSENNDNCIDDMHYTKTVYIKKYNKFSEKEICKNDEYKNFEYCNENYQGTITEEKFNSELKKYEEKLKEESEIQEVTTDDNKFNMLYIIYAGAGVLLVTVIVIIIVSIRRKRRWKF